MLFFLISPATSRASWGVLPATVRRASAGFARLSPAAPCGPRAAFDPPPPGVLLAMALVTSGEFTVSGIVTMLDSRPERSRSSSDTERGSSGMARTMNSRARNASATPAS